MRPIRFIASAPSITAWFPVDLYLPAMNIGIFLTTSGLVTGTGSVEVTGDNIFDTTITPVAFAADTAGLTNATGNAKGAQTTPIRAIRLNTNVSGTGSWILTIDQQGDM